MNTRMARSLLAVCLAGASTGCSKALTVSNLDQYFSAPLASEQPPLKLGITSTSDSHPEKGRYVSAIVDALRKNSGVEKIVYPYSSAAGGDQLDGVVAIEVDSRYSGRGTNFLVNWPGFLIFAPAIWGYGYEAQVDTSVNIHWLLSGQSQQLDVPAKFKFRQAEFDRTWTEIGWLEVGLIPLIGGIVFTQYDTDVTDGFITKVSPNYGVYVANKIMGAMQQR